ncbi:hypothetical protein GW17_00040668 [Ensete ventricosum]|nr:hypothetical protein GW17_00040668 [Ensete ventricosum]
MWGCPLRPGHGCCLRSEAPPLQAPAMPAGDRACWRLPLQGALAVAGRPLAAGLAVGGRHFTRAGRGWGSYIPVFQIRIEKMKEVKRPPL